MKQEPVEEIIIPLKKGMKFYTNWEKYNRNATLWNIKANLLNDSNVSKCDKKWIEVNDLSIAQYSVNNNIRCNKTSMLRSDLCTIVIHILLQKRQQIF